MTELKLAHSLKFADLYEDEGLRRIDALFLDRLGAADAALRDRLVEGRKNPEALAGKPESDLLLAVGPHLEGFVADLFGIGGEAAALAARHADLDSLYECKRNFVQRVAAKAFPADEAAKFDGAALEAQLKARFGGRFDQFVFARHVTEWQKETEKNAEGLDLAKRYAAWAVHSPAGRHHHAGDVLFRLIGKPDYFNLVPVIKEKWHGVEAMRLSADHYRRRDGFDLTDKGWDLAGALDQANYCVICHDRGRDYCSRGQVDKETKKFSANPLGVSLAGCPLEEKISEMHKMKIEGRTLAALAIIAVDNPMAAGTGHRICNDCMKSCIFQKQDQVNIPQVETRVLKDVLELPWGFEIYGLLTRWNPLNLRRPLPAAASGYKVLVVGLGPAGFTLSHYLLNAGHTVVAIDGLKIEPLPAELSGVKANGERVPFRPIRDVTELYESLDSRMMAGFGGVAEYGITVRWNKNFLKVIRLLLERRRAFAVYGGVRFGSAITAEDAFAMGFDHVALCLGAGRPTFLEVPNGLARGVRQASDFLMALQLTGAANRSSLANLQIRMPVVVVGGGLTAIDTATEALAYYVRQVEKFLVRYETLVHEKGEAAVRAAWNPEEAGIADEFVAHGRAIRAEREAAAKEGRAPRFIELLDQWGGATIAYRRRMIDSPSYTLNHEEIEKAMEEGMRFAELLSPVAVEIDQYGHAKALKLSRQAIGEGGKIKASGEEVMLPARSILIAAGTTPNTVLAREHPGFATLDGKYFQAYGEDGQPASPERTAKPGQTHVLMRIEKDGRAISFFGDLHPSFAGNVVKAMASARRGFPVVERTLQRRQPSAVKPAELVARLDDGLRAVVHKVLRLTPTIIEVIVRAPLAARAFRPGQFFRLQNYEANARQVDGTVMAMEGLALTGAWVDRDKGLVSLIVLEMGGSSNLCMQLEPGEPVVLMGPTGAPTHIEAGETVLLAGGGLGNAVLFSIGKALREAGAKVLYFAAYKGVHDRFHIEDIEAAADSVVWCCDQAPGFKPTRAGDKAFVGNIVEAMVAYGGGKLGPVDIKLSQVDRVIAIGSDMMMAAVAKARHTVLKDILKDDHVGIASINSPMQCMMKEICAQCLQRHVDPATGKEKVVFTCFNQDQPLDMVDFAGLRQRLAQNGVQEKLTRQWIARCVESLAKAAE
jgi:NADPH-dependent glutamate synthase beta subunit-like oxidoreductase/NAD(P)H-flavin reductase